MESLLSSIDTPTKLRALPAEQLPRLCDELREAIISLCGKVGGHLGASLGVVELTVALHRVFKSPVDRIVFDVGHQAYAHKFLTSRGPRMPTLRQPEGLGPFLDPRESPHDGFAAGHSCTAVSAALGILEAKRRQGQPGQVVAVVGDGALTGGLSFEGLSNAGAWPEPLIVVLNDNDMSISPNVGAVARMLRGAAARGFFESLGFSYLGPVDGHDLSALDEALRQAKRSLRPIVVHVKTKKGKGFAAAEDDARTRGHAMGPYELRDGKLVRSRGGAITFSEAFAAELGRAMEDDPRVVAVTPAMIEGSALGALKDRFGDRVYDVGIAEQHAVTFSAGLALAGLRPVCLIYSTFLQRAYDQIIHDVCLTGLPVVFAVDRAGLVGADGATHQGAYDLSFLRPLPGMTVLAPADGGELRSMLAYALAQRGPVAMRFPRGTLPAVAGEASDAPALPQARWLRQVPQAELSIIALGPLAHVAGRVAAERSWNVLDARAVSPLDEGAVLAAAACGRVIVIEEGTTRGGLGGAVLEVLARHGRERGVEATVKVKLLGLPDVFVPHGDARRQRVELELDEAGLERAAWELLA